MSTMSQQQMEGGMDKDCSALGMLFQTIINDMRGSSVIWEDFTSKAAKLHSSLKATLGAIGGFLDAFQKVADMATGSRGATKEIGTALTRLCMRHKSIETKLKTLTSTIIDNLVTPLQEKSEDWKKTVAQLDKEHAKEYKKARQEIKKCATDTMRLQKKVKKGKSDIQTKLDHAMKDVTDKYMMLEEAEKSAVRTALIEERSRFCLFISCLRPFVEHELSLLTEITHLQDITHSLCLMAGEPNTLPSSSEQIIMDIKGSDSTSFFNNLSGPSPPSSPSSIGSRKSSMCSISSINSSSSGSVQSHSPSHHTRNRNSLQQFPMGTIRLQSVSSQDSGFTSQDTLFQRPVTPSSLNIRQKDGDSASIGGHSDTADSSSSTPSDNTPSASSTWTNWPNQPITTKADTNIRPHTISSAYEKNHNRPALSAQLFEPPPQESAEDEEVQMRHPHKKKTYSIADTPYTRPPSASINKMQPVLPPLAPKPKVKAVAPPKIPLSDAEQPAYVNLTDLANMEKDRQREQSTDSDRTPTDKSPPDTAPIQRKQNSMELAKAIQELEASTAALQCNYETSSNASQHSLQCSSGYGTMNSTPSSSEDTIATGDFVLSRAKAEQEKYYTIPRNSEIGNVYKAVLQSKRPASTAGIPVSGVGLGRRSSMNQQQSKPPPPVRRSSSITTANPAVLQKLRKTPPREQPPIPQSSSRPGSHRRSGSSGSQSEPAYAELQEIQQSIQARQSRHEHQETIYASTTAAQNPYNQHNSSQYVPNSQPIYGHAVPPDARAMMPPPSGPQYSQTGVPHYHQNLPAGQVDMVKKLNARFAAMNASLQEEELPPPPPDIMHDPDLPPPPSAEELQEIGCTFSQAPPPVYSKPQTNNSSDSIRASLVSELKSGPRLKRVNSKDEGSEC
ncbi:protein MTSS 1-like isoform X2 [Mytilus californianus]|uniref:protein MTSS 1-like isoform X2 n=1 Tax=Mytilus californianus TaxID=6549 RepID=UPI002246503E|nr:protein MTSS 1-like isoform X2 [Mytilus californianus]